MSESVAMTSELDAQLAAFLLRGDGQEDVCFVTYSTSTGATRRTAILREMISPVEGDREVHGNASISSDYVLRAADMAARAGMGLALVHSHPAGSGWQGLSRQDFATEAELSRLVEAVTGKSLVGMTLAGRDESWSARIWTSGRPLACENVRSVGNRLKVSWNEASRPAPATSGSQSRTVAAWGEAMQRDVARLKILVVGVGSVGLEIAVRLAATGVQCVSVMDPDTVSFENLDRMIGATRRDAKKKNKKVALARRLMTQAATAEDHTFNSFDMRVNTEEGLSAVLDFDLVFSCVDSPLPRALLNSVAYSDLIPVIDGGIAIDCFANGRMRGATWRAHVLTPGMPCAVCIGQVSPIGVSRELAGVLDNPKYLENLGESTDLISPNVAVLSAGAIGALLAQFVSLVVAPCGIGASRAQQFALPGQTEIPLDVVSAEYCAYESRTGWGNNRLSYVQPRVERRARPTELGRRPHQHMRGASDRFSWARLRSRAKTSKSD